jgi:hypothetical protein
MISDVLEKKRDERSKLKDRQALSDSIGDNFSNTLRSIISEVKNLNQTQQSELIRVLATGLRVTNLNEVKVPPIDITKIEAIVARLEDAVSKINFKPVINVPEAKVSVEIPEIPAPIVNLPETKQVEPKVTVNAPDFTEIISEIRLLNDNLRNVGYQAETKEPKVLEEKDIYREGFYDGFEQKFDDGSIHIVTGMAVGKIKHKYA